MKTLKSNAAAGVSLDQVSHVGPFQVTTRSSDGRILFREKRASKRQAELLYSKAINGFERAIK